MRILRTTLFLLAAWIAMCTSAPAEDVKIDVARLHVEAGATAYYMVFGEWPKSWQDVVRSGIVQASLTTIYGLPCNPDGTSIRAVNEPHYLPGKDGTPPSIGEYFDLEGGPTMQIDRLTVPNLLSNILNTNRLGDRWNGDKRVLCQLATANMMNRSMPLFVLKYKRQPNSWSDLLGSGLKPIDGKSINPVTGKPYRGDGSPNDLRFQQNDDEDGNLASTNIWVIGPDGEVLFPMVY